MKKLYWREHQDKKSIGPNVVITTEDMMAQVKGFFEDPYDEELPPIFEPVMMTENEFKSLPEFDGF